MKSKYTPLIDKVKSKNPLVHHITNYVTVNDCANITLSIGGSPIMADDIDEAEEIVGIGDALVLNIGTLNKSSIASMIAAGKAANKKGIPVVFDPVGAGASSLRNKTTAKILSAVDVSVICGNISEISFIAGLNSKTNGVDASREDIKEVTESALIVRDLAKRLGCVVVATGETDIVSDGSKVVCIQNGHPMLSNISGTGCMCTSLVGCFCGANRDDIFSSTVSALICMGVAGELAYKNAGGLGNGSFKVSLHDQISKLSSNTLFREARLYEA